MPDHCSLLHPLRPARWKMSMQIVFNTDFGAHLHCYLIYKIPLVNWVLQQAQTVHANKQRYQWCNSFFVNFLVNSYVLLSQLGNTCANSTQLNRCSMCLLLTGDSNDNKPAVGAEEEEVAKMGCPSLGEHTKLEVVIEESYEFKVSPVKQNNTAFMKWSYLLNLSHSLYLNPCLLVPMVTVLILKVTGVR